MKKVFLCWLILVFVLVACQQAQTLPITATRYRVSDTPAAPSPTGTMTATRYRVSETPTASTIPPSATPSQTISPPIPTRTIAASPSSLPLDLPAIPEKMSAHPLALNEINVGIEMKRLNTYGTGHLKDFIFSPDGKYLAVSTSRGVFLYDSQTFKEISFIDVDDSVNAFAFSPSNAMLAMAVRGKVSLWNILSKQKLIEMDGDFAEIYTLAYSKAGYIAAAGATCYYPCDPSGHKIVVWDAKTGQQIDGEEGIGYKTTGLVFTKDGKRLAYGGQDGLSLWNAETKERMIISKLSGESKFSEFIFNADETSLFVVPMNTTASSRTIEIASGKSGPFHLCDSNLAAGKRVGACFGNSKLILFDLSNGQKQSERIIYHFDELLRWVWDREIALRPDGEVVLYKSEHLIHILNTKTGEEIKTLVFNSFYEVQTDLIVLNGQAIYVAAIPNQYGKVDLINLENGAYLQTYSLLPATKIKGFAFRPDQKTVATLDNTYSLTLWNIQTQKILYQRKLFDFFLPPFTFSPNGFDLFFTSGGYDVVKIEQFSGAVSEPIGSNNSYGLAAPYFYDYYHFNPAGHLISFSIDHNTPEFKDTVTGEKQIVPVELDASLYLNVAYNFNANGKFIALGTTNTIFVWNLEKNQQEAALIGHGGLDRDQYYQRIRGVLFSPQNDLLASTGWDGTTRLWNARAGQELRRLNVCCQAQFTPDGRYLVTVGDGVLRVWGISTP